MLVHSLHGDCAGRSSSRMVLAGLRAHWRHGLGAAFVLADIAVIHLLFEGHFTLGLLAGVVMFSATFMGMFDFDGLRQGIIWTMVSLGLAWTLLVSVRTGQIGLALMLAVASVLVVALLARRARNWLRQYERAHPVSRSAGIRFIDAPSGAGIKFLDPPSSQGIQFPES